ncbi:MAG: copper chaperone PCu(A)C [Rhodocyclaceae bacterium]|nr:copper chaperone PCu(A)C [Rhodocyclaceae bacterium]
MSFRSHWQGLAASLLLMATAQAAHADVLAIRDAYVREMPPVARNTAAFLVLANPGQAAVTVVGASTPAAARAELHDHLRDGEVMRMRRVESVEVPAGGEVRFAPGGLHVMLMDLAAPLRAGQVVAIDLVLADGQHVTVQAPVRPMATMGMPPAAGGGHGDMRH